MRIDGMRISLNEMHPSLYNTVISPAISKAGEYKMLSTPAFKSHVNRSPFSQIQFSSSHTTNP